MKNFVYDPILLGHIKRFDDTIMALIRRQQLHQSKDCTIVFINEVLSDYKLFPHILRSNKDRLSHLNIAIDDETIDDFVIAMQHEASLFSFVQQSFLHMVKSFLSSPTDTFLHIRGLILLLIFGNFYEYEQFETTFISILAHINRLSKEIQDIFYASLQKLPRVIRHIINISQNLLTLYILQNEPINPNASLFFTFSEFFTNLRNKSAFQCTPPFHSIDFINDVFSECFDAKSLFSQSNSPFFTYPAVLSMKLKNELFHIYQESLQEQNMTRAVFENLNTFFMNGGRVSDDFVRQLHLNIEVRRDHIVEDTIRQLESIPESHLARKLMVQFRGESGYDAGGVSREYFHLLMGKLFSPDYGMFTLINNKYYWFNPVSYEDQRTFQTLGKVISIAIYNSIILPIRFPLLLYKKILHYKITLNDMMEINESVVKSFQQMLKMKEDGEDISDLMLNFTATIDVFGNKKEVNLIENGDNIDVTNENVEIYIEKYLDWYTNKSIESSFNAFYDGFTKLCHGKFFEMFTPDEIDILASGEKVLDWNALKQNAKYSDGYTPKSKQVIWFWEIFDELNDEMKSKFLQFTTGTDGVPLGGLANVIITIQKSTNTKLLPTSHTCFSIFTLPCYRTKAEMKKKVLIAITHTEGFGFI
ncbi:ubiquitin ligase [Histomonas meleagridis]|uniref:ubiquitin ligase n=1 Tax=Histomonas meleagridis TaxID=135588 RepID=UPI003559688E|nr:ubiquitin ligase [Histomonas meleagridis]KAH0797767.1 ubiquitin ligase [Histomonas meleagridis]